MRVARILAILLALLTLAISSYYAWLVPQASWYLIPAVLGALMMLGVWRDTPARKRSRRRAAMLSGLFVPLLMASAAASMLVSPLSTWPVYLALAMLAAMLAIFAALRINRKSVHPWQDYYPATFK